MAVAQRQGSAHRGGGELGRQAPGAEAQDGHGVAAGEGKDRHWAGHGGGHYGISGSALASLGLTTTPEQIDRFVEELIGAIGFRREHT
ncbi:hypothetical protein [Vulcanococcus limneticus]|uniref:hypothetical protein n=1 Tax=Vulcanococcus limneticus TaxID=2170428 RepID=UPI00398BE769